MKKITFLALLSFLTLLAQPVFANTVWGTVKSVNNNLVSVDVMSSDKKNVPASLDLHVDNSTKLKDVSAASDLTAGDKVKAKIEEKDGMFHAKSIEKVDQIPAGQNKS